MPLVELSHVARHVHFSIGLVETCLYTRLIEIWNAKERNQEPIRWDLHLYGFS